jgi:hypothetical protein
MDPEYHFWSRPHTGMMGGTCGGKAAPAGYFQLRFSEKKKQLKTLEIGQSTSNVIR